MVREETQKLLNKWDFENNYPYNYMLVLSNFAPKLIFGKHVVSKNTTTLTLLFTIESLWKSPSPVISKLSDIIKQFIIDGRDIKVVNPVEDYLAQWDKVYFFNCEKVVSEKQEKYLNKLLEDCYHNENIRFWIIAGEAQKNKGILAELLKKADFNIHSRQAVIVINTDVFGFSVILTKDLQSKWSLLAENQVKQSAQFYYEKDWYYDVIKETFLMTKEELLYKNTIVRQQQEQIRLTEILQQNKIYAPTIKMHKMLFWFIAFPLLFVLIWSKKYVEKTFAGESVKKLSNMKFVLGMGYLLLLALAGISIVHYTPLFYVHKPVPEMITSGFLWIILYFLVLLLLYHKKIIRNNNSVKILLFCTTVLYFFCIPMGYVLAKQEEWLTENAFAGTDALNIVGAILLAFLIISKKKRVDETNKMTHEYNSGTSLRKGFGKKEYVSRYASE
jgi:hypothetical protein